MKKDEKNAEIEDFNVWEPKDYEDPNNPETRDNKYLIWGENWKPLDVTEVFSLKSQQEKYNYLQNWRKKYCKSVSEKKFNEEIENNRENKNFRGLVFPGGIEEEARKDGYYDYSIFTDETDFILNELESGKNFWGYLFREARFRGEIQFIGGGSIFDLPFPFWGAKICKGGGLSIFENVGSIFKERNTKTAFQQLFLGLEIEEGGFLRFISCYFPEGFTLRNLNLKTTFFTGSNIEKIRFINCDFTEKKGSLFTPARLILADEDQEVTDNRELAVMYQLMKKSLEDQKDYQTAGKFYVSEMVFRQKEATGVKKFVLSAYGFLAGYGESVWRTGFLLAFCIFLAGALPQIASCLSDILPYLASLSLPSSFFAKISSFSTSLAAFLSSLFAFFGSFVFFPIVFGFLFDALVFLLDSLETGAAKLLFLRDSEGKTWFDIIPRSLFIVSGFLFINAIRRRLRRS